MRPFRNAITALCLASLPILTTNCAGGIRLVPDLKTVERPEPPAVLTQGCPVRPPMPPRRSLPANDVRPLVAVMAQQIDAGDQCRIVVDGWKAWDTCMRLRLKNQAAACPVLDAIVQQLTPPDLPPPQPLF